MNHIVSFSGGKDSTAMLFKMIEKRMTIDEIVFVDLGFEFPDMYKHIELVRHCVDIPFTVEKPNNGDYEYWMIHRERTKGTRIGEVGYGWPNINSKWCTRLKIDSIERGRRRDYHYQGIAFDEKHRMNNKETSKYPLVDWGMTEKDCLQYCYSLGFKWGGLYERFDRVSCFLCPFQRIGELRTLYHHYPELWVEIKRLDSHTDSKFSERYGVDQLEQRFIEEESQLKLKY